MSISVIVLSDEGAIVPSYPHFCTAVANDAGAFSQTLFNHELPEADFLGIFTGGVYLSASPSQEHVINEDYVYPQAIVNHGLDDAEAMIRLLDECDVVSSYPTVHSHSLKQILVSDFYVESDDLQTLRLIISEKFPKLEHFLLQSLGMTTMYEPIAIIMQRDRFLQFWDFAKQVICDWHERRSVASFPLSRIQSLQFLFPLLYQTFITSLPDIRVKHITSVSFHNTMTRMFLPSWKNDAVPVVFASNERFAPALGVCMHSLLAYASPERYYDIAVLESDLSDDSKHRLLLLCSRYPMVQLQFFNPQHLLKGHRIQKNPTDHISLETYYRFLIADILPQYSKVLYLDCDTVILDDVAKLFDVQLGDNVLAAALDPEIPSMAMGEDPSLKEYMQTVLAMRMDDPYLQAGVLVIDLRRMQNLHSVDEWIALAGERRYRYNDQDILNKECKGRFLQLPMEWNTVVDCNHRRMPIIKAGPYEIYAAYIEA
ncbi:MAG: glycosyltransferase family 8 protein, partial [Spirochaetales bacterium]|nr:glycosyltransferase family 8 protein [Spirochaetales bacterium]